MFSGQTDLPWVKILKAGFRHCYVIMHDGEHWLSLDPLSSHTEITVHSLPVGFDLPAWLAEQGENIVPAPMNRKHRNPAPWMIFSCVEAIKRLLGIHKRLIITPWQLYCHLAKLEISALPHKPIKQIKGDI